MLVVRVELHSAITRHTTEIARMIIANDGTGDSTRGNYWARAAKGETPENMLPAAIMHASRKLRHVEVKDYPRYSKHVWNLVARVLAAMKYK
jgi:hypothetical protein